MIHRDSIDLAPLDVEEIDDVPFDFSGHMRADETISVVSVKAELQPGGAADPSPQAMVVGGHVIGNIDEENNFTPAADGRVVLQRFTAADRPVRNNYTWRCVVTLSSGRRLTAAANVTVVRL